MHNPDGSASPTADPGSELQTLGQVTRGGSEPDGLAGRPQTTPAARGTRRPPQDPPISPETPELLLPEADAHPGAPKDSRLPGAPAYSPAWAWAPDHDSCGSCRDWRPEASKPAPPALRASPSRDPTRQRPRRLCLRMSCSPRLSWAPRSLLEPSLRGISLGPTQCPTMSLSTRQ
ncbi:occludin/ELL domain-containing protein 1 isoform X2 [Homo sapiens]|uniref:occludin/ELL domain-containing protein 1 isoform X2 n=2 Tax=Homo sapiens TaxID=9606 RepID=UPI0023DF1A03|nr:occludin/ELL domain-containing protein 1 isoform X2 [Homo sapiens]